MNDHFWLALGLVTTLLALVGLLLWKLLEFAWTPPPRSRNFD